MPVAFLNSGNKAVKRPDCSVEVVDAITIGFVCAIETVAACAHKIRAAALNDTEKRPFFIIQALL
jgi:hypothetical protein